MSHECSCSTHTEPPPSSTGVLAEQTVAEVSKRPGTLEVLHRLGINHCCGGHFSLGEAAAAAGISLDTLLRALDESVSTPA
jgi:iron-sulfur cluster repair protein YtfE (RIC family)